jgi:hypothetical protein
MTSKRLPYESYSIGAIEIARATLAELSKPLKND